MRHALDRPVWSALCTGHAAWAEGGDLAKRYPSSIYPFAAARDDRRESLRALGELTAPDENLLLLQADNIALPPGFIAPSTASAVQMLAPRPIGGVTDERVVRLTEADLPEMLTLAALTKPGPFSLRALRLGDFWGIKANGKLLAMAGERMKLTGYTELSGVCTHPDFQGRGLARVLSLFVAERIFERGEQPYLHAYATNATAITLYESIGFKLRSGMNVAMILRRP